MDITTDGFGFMLNFGDLCWVPFVYTLQARYLAFHPTQLGELFVWSPLYPVQHILIVYIISKGTFWTTTLFVLNATGYWIFRSSNNEKDEFRKGKNPKSAFIDSSRFSYFVSHKMFSKI